MEIASLFSFSLFHKVSSSLHKSITMSSSHLRISQRSYLLPVTEERMDTAAVQPGSPLWRRINLLQTTFYFLYTTTCQPPLKAICFWPTSSGSCSRTERAVWHVVSKRRRGGKNSVLIWLDLAKIPNRGWSAVLVVSERLTLSLYHGNNLLLKPRKQINYVKDVSHCHYRVIRRNIFIQRAGQ